MKSHLPSSEEPSHRSSLSHNTDLIDLVRGRLLIYYRSKRETVLSYGYSWRDLAEQIFVYTSVRIPGDSLRQFARKQVSRGSPRGISPKRLQTLIRFLSHRQISALSLEELKAPDVPYRFVLELMEFLRHDEHSDLVLPSPALEGAYCALQSSQGEIATIRLDIVISEDRRFVRLTESTEVFTNPGLGDDPAEWSFDHRSRLLKKRSKSRGWGIMTPESNLLVFMKRVPYGVNHYYVTMGGLPEFTDPDPVQHLALLVHDYPYFDIDHENDQQWFEQINRNMVSRHLLHFVRITKA